MNDSERTGISTDDAFAKGRADGASVRLVLPRVPLRGRDGIRVGSSTGQSLEFHDYRDYLPGDDLRMVDWNVYARTDREVVKLHREEIAPMVDLFIDESPSMSEPEVGKAAALRYLEGFLESAAGKSGCIVRRHSFLPGRPIDPRDLRPRSIRILASDLLFADSPDAVADVFSRDGASLSVIRLLTAWELRPKAGGAAECEDSETGEKRELRFDSATIDAYLANLERHTAAWTNALRRHGASFASVEAEELLAGRAVDALARGGIVEGAR